MSEYDKWVYIAKSYTDGEQVHRIMADWKKDRDRIAELEKEEADSQPIIDQLMIDVREWAAKTHKLEKANKELSEYAGEFHTRLLERERQVSKLESELAEAKEKNRSIK